MIVLTHVTGGHIGVVKQWEVFEQEYSYSPISLIKVTNMAAISLFCNTNMAAVTSDENLSDLHPRVFNCAPRFKMQVKTLYFRHTNCY